MESHYLDICFNGTSKKVYLKTIDELNEDDRVDDVKPMKYS